MFATRAGRPLRRLPPLLSAMLFATTGAACSEVTGVDDEQKPASSLEGRYSGTLVTTIQYRDAFGRVLGSETYRISGATVTIAPPRSYRGQRESNPLSFILESNPRAFGAVSVYSAFGGTYTDPRTNRSVDALFTSWKLSVSGSRVSGDLVDNLTSAASAVSQIMAGNQIYPGGPFVLWPYPLRNGTRFTARLVGNELRVEITGNSASGDRPFTAELVARRI